MNIGERIFELRKIAGLSQEEFAEKLGVSRQSVSKWESGNVMPDLDKIVSMCALFNVTTDYLIKGEKKDPEPESREIEEIIVGTLEQEDEPGQSLVQEIEEEICDAPRQPEAASQKPPYLRVLAIVLAICVGFALILPIPLGGYKKLFAKLTEEPVAYTYVLVHGLGGWGDSAGINSVAPYWGAATGSLSEYLNTQGYKVKEATVGPFSSSWDRACELYAQLTGTQVDYGAAHSAKHGHERFGRTYSSPVVPEWGTETEGGQLNKINLIGHSFGGNTIRLLTSLLEYGSESEKAASADDLSPLFEGGKGEYINSVVTLCSPHNGSTLYYVLDKGELIETALGVLRLAGGITDILQGGAIDFQLEHFGIQYGTTSNSLMNSSFISGNDNAFYDLSPHGAMEMNEQIKAVESVLYISYSFCTTTKSPLSNNQIATLDTMLILKPIAGLIGSYLDVQATKSPVPIDESWLPNDGLVNVVSARSPSDETPRDYAEGEELERGVWYVMPTLTGDHGTVIGMGGNVNETHDFYTELITMVDSVKR